MLNPPWRKWAADHPVRARRLAESLSTALETCPEMGPAHRAVLEAKRDEIRLGLQDHATELNRRRLFADGTRVGTS